MSNKPTIEEINGVAHTVIWYIEPFTKANGDFGRECPFLQNYGYMVAYNQCTKIYAGVADNGDVEWVGLPPLPRNPTADNAKLLHLYAAYGLKPYAFPHAINDAGERVEIAIIGGER